MSAPVSTSRAVVYASVVFVTGVLAGVLWHAVVTVPTFLTAADGSVQMTERAQAQIFTMDAAYGLIGLLLGLLLGVLTWQMWSIHGWRTVIVGFVASLAAGLLCWGVGVLLGPSDFATRVVTAQPGDRVPIDFALRARSAVGAWCVGTTAVLVGYALGSRDPADRPSARRRTRSREVHETRLENLPENPRSDLDRQTPTSA